MAEPITNVLGVVGMKTRGEYDSETTYEKLNVVTYNGSSYCAKTDTQGNLPTNTNYWDLIAEKGDKGDTGDDGYTPVKGTDYYTAEDKSELEATLSSDVTSEVTTQVGDLVSATPLVASSTAGMTDTTRIYVNTTDGHWYWYNGSSWIDGGVYQSTSLGEGEVDVVNLTEELKFSTNADKPTIPIISGAYIRYNGSYDTSAGFYITDYIKLYKGDKIKFTAKGNSTGGVAILSYKYSDTGASNIALIISEDNDSHEFVYTALAEGDYRISSIGQPSNICIYRKNYSTVDFNHLIEKTDYIDNIIENKVSDSSFTNGKYILRNGSMDTLSGYSVTDYIEVLSNEYISLISNGVKLSSAAATAIVIYDEYKQRITGYNYPTETNILSFKSPANAKYVRFTVTPYMKKNSYSLCYSSLSNQLYNIRNSIASIDKSYYPNLFEVFSNITCIGDSLTYGIVSTGSGTHRIAYKPYPTVLSKITGVECTNLSHGGDTATAAWNRWSESIVSKTNQLTIIYLGTNGGLTDTVETDCVGDDYTQYANTNTGNYAKLIKKSLDAGSKVLLVKTYGTSDTGILTNTVIDKLAERFNVVSVINPNLADNVYHYYPDLTGVDTLHYNDIGYTVFTYQLIFNVSQLSNVMKSRLIPM